MGPGLTLPPLWLGWPSRSEPMGLAICHMASTTADVLCQSALTTFLLI